MHWYTVDTTTNLIQAWVGYDKPDEPALEGYTYATQGGWIGSGSYNNLYYWTGGEVIAAKPACPYGEANWDYISRMWKPPLPLLLEGLESYEHWLDLLNLLKTDSEAAYHLIRVIASQMANDRANQPTILSAATTFVTQQQSP